MERESFFIAIFVLHSAYSTKYKLWNIISQDRQYFNSVPCPTAVLLLDVRAIMTTKSKFQCSEYHLSLMNLDTYDFDLSTEKALMNSKLYTFVPSISKMETINTHSKYPMVMEPIGKYRGSA